MSSQPMVVSEKSDELPAGLSQTTLSHGKLSSHSFSSTTVSEDHLSAGSPDRGTVAAGLPREVTQPRSARSPSRVTQPRSAGSPGRVTQPKYTKPDASPHTVKDSDPHFQSGRAKSIPSWSPVAASDATTPSPHSSSAPPGQESNTQSASSSKSSSTQCLYPGGDNNSTRWFNAKICFSFLSRNVYIKLLLFFTVMLDAVVIKPLKCPSFVSWCSHVMLSIWLANNI